MDKYVFQYCQKLVILSKDLNSVLLCKRKGEADYDSVYSFPGGKMEITDGSIITGLQREKNEELGESFKIKLASTYSYNVRFVKNDGSIMILPHYLAIYGSGNISLSDEYSEFQWVSLNSLNGFEPKIPNIPEVVQRLMGIKDLTTTDYEII